MCYNITVLWYVFKPNIDYDTQYNVGIKYLIFDVLYVLNRHWDAEDHRIFNSFLHTSILDLGCDFPSHTHRRAGNKPHLTAYKERRIKLFSLGLCHPIPSPREQSKTYSTAWERCSVPLYMTRRTSLGYGRSPEAVRILWLGEKSLDTTGIEPRSFNR
jgi:hypothetical protein